MHVTRNLREAMEWCGSYNFGQWADVFGKPQFPSAYADLSSTASQIEFGHPYAFVGVPGIGPAMAWESLMLPTGHYLAAGKTSPAEIRLVVYFDYISQHYFVSLPSVSVKESDYFIKGNPPPFGLTVHNPIPQEKHDTKCELPNCREYVKGVKTYLQSPRLYSPYIGTLRHQFDRVREKNETFPPAYYGFHIITPANVKKKDPRPDNLMRTELEVLWGGPSSRWETDPVTEVITEVNVGIPFGAPVGCFNSTTADPCSAGERCVVYRRLFARCDVSSGTTCSPYDPRSSSSSSEWTVLPLMDTCPTIDMVLASQGTNKGDLIHSDFENYDTTDCVCENTICEDRTSTPAEIESGGTNTKLIQCLSSTIETEFVWTHAQYNTCDKIMTQITDACTKHPEVAACCPSTCKRCRPCVDYLHNGIFDAHPETCGVDGSKCCRAMKSNAHLPVFHCLTGVVPNICPLLNKDEIAIRAESFTKLELRTAPPLQPRA